MDASEIIDRGTLEEWLMVRPEATRQRDSVWIATRIAARVFPSRFYFRWYLPESSGQDKRELTALPILRALLTSGVAADSPTAEVKDAAAAALAALAVFGTIADTSNAATAAGTAAAFATTTATTADAAAFVVAAAATTTPTAAGVGTAAAIWEQIRTDAQAIDIGQDASQLPLWSGAIPDRFQSADAETRRVWAEDPPGTWDFWLRWWDGVLSGQQLNRDVQTQVALIRDEFWQLGPEKISNRICLLAQKKLIQEEIAALNKRLVDVLFDLDSLGRHTDNNPPDDSISATVLRQRLLAAKAALEDLEKELSLSEPESERVFSVIERLRTAWEALSAWARIAVSAAVVTTGLTVGLVGEGFLTQIGADAATELAIGKSAGIAANDAKDVVIKVDMSWLAKQLETWLADGGAARGAGSGLAHAALPPNP